MNPKVGAIPNFSLLFGSFRVAASILVRVPSATKVLVRGDIGISWTTAAQHVDGLARAHNPKVAGSNPAPAWLGGQVVAQSSDLLRMEGTQVSTTSVSFTAQRDLKITFRCWSHVCVRTLARLTPDTHACVAKEIS